MRGLQGSRWLLALAVPAILLAQDAGRGVARLSVMSGEVSIRRGDSGDQIAAALNAPLVSTDRLYTGATSRAEVQFDYANFLRLASNAEVRFAELLDKRYQIQLAAGLVTFTVLRDSQADVEVSTPSVAVRPLKRGAYRILVNPEGETEIVVRAGEAEIFTPAGTERLKSGQMMRVRGDPSNPEFQVAGAYGDDDWDRWNRSRDRDLDRSSGYRYTSRDIAGVEDLDPYGSWVTDADYGSVWVPRVAAGWAPYRLGRWVWLDWWGWSWVSYDPWGWAPYHYGRWYYGNRGWCWWPGGGVGVRQTWSPALVAFFGWGHGSGVGVGFGSVGWVPLGPREPFHPWWGPGIYSGFRGGAHVQNNVTIVNNVNIYNTYRNARVNNAITGLDGADFVRGRAGAGMHLRGDEWNHINMVRGALPMAPERESLRMSDRVVAAPVRAAGNDGRFYTRRAAATVDRIPFEEQRAGMQQISRRASDFMSGQRSGMPAAVRENQGRIEAGASGYGRAGSPAEPAARSNEPSASGYGRARGVDAPATERGWRRADEPANPGASGYGRAPAGDNPQNGSSWRRFGEPRTLDRGSQSSSGYGRAAGADVRPADGSRRFGEPRVDQGTAGQGQSAPSGYGQRTTGGDAGRRFGGRTIDRGAGRSESTPPAPARTFEGRVSGAESSASESRPAVNSGNEAARDSGRSRFAGETAPAVETPRVEGSSGYGRASGGESGGRSRESAAPARQWGNFGASRGESLNVNPPIVRQRSESGGNASRGGGSHSRANAPASSGGGGGSAAHSNGGGGGRSGGGGRGEGGGGGRGGRGR